MKTKIFYSLIAFAVLLSIGFASAWTGNNLQISSASSQVVYNFETDNDGWNLFGFDLNTIERLSVGASAKNGTYVIKLLARVCGSSLYEDGLYINKTMDYSGILSSWVYAYAGEYLRFRLYKNDILINNITSEGAWGNYNISVLKGDGIKINVYRSANCGSADAGAIAWIDYITIPYANFTAENLTFIENSNITRFLQIPNSVTALTKGYLNLSGYGNFSAANFCYQETTNASTVGDGSCSLNYSGLYSFDTAWTDLQNVYDGNSSSWGYNTGGAGTAYFNYSSPVNAVNNLGTVWTIITGCSSGTNKRTSNLALPSSCIGNITQTKDFIDGSTRVNTFSCWDYSSSIWHELLAINDCGSTQRGIYEEFINWSVSNHSYITNPSLIIGNSNAWNSLGLFSQANNKTNNLASIINQYLTASYLVGTNYLIPFIFHSDSAGIFEYSDLLFNNEGLIENSQSYNATTYETSSENFIINLTYDNSYWTGISANLIYDGTSYAGTKTGTSNIIFSRSLSIPTVTAVENNSFYWQITLSNGTGYFYYNSTTNNQTVNPIILTFCNSTYDVTYINFTFKDESTGEYLNASTDLASFTYWFSTGANKTYYFTNNSLNPSYAYCVSPSDKSIGYALTYQYASTGYPQRQYYKSGTLTNTTTNQALYLLGTANNGIYSSIIIMTTTGTPIPGVTITVERQFAGLWIVIAQGTTDSAGMATFFLNPSYDHRFTAVKSGLVSTVATIKPTQAVYSIIMSGGGLTIGTYNWTLQGIYYTRTPAVGIIQPGNYDFTFNVTAQENNMQNCRLDLTNSSGYVLATVSSACTSNAYLTINYNVVSGDDIYGKYYIDFGSGYVMIEGDGNWKCIPTNTSSWRTLKNFLSFLSDNSVWTDGSVVELKKWEFTKIVGFFLVFAIILAFLNVTFNFDLVNPGIALFGLPFIFIIMSAANGLFGHGYFYVERATGFVWFDNYVLAFYSLLMAIGFYFASLRREG